MALAVVVAPTLAVPEVAATAPTVAVTVASARVLEPAFAWVLAAMAMAIALAEAALPRSENAIWAESRARLPTRWHSSSRGNRVGPLRVRGPMSEAFEGT